MLKKTALYSRELKTSFSTDFEIFISRNKIAVFTEWCQPEEPENCSRADIRKACRLGRGF